MDSNYWAYGNTNQAARNLYHVLDSKKLAIIIDILYHCKPDKVTTELKHLIMVSMDNTSTIQVRKWKKIYKMIMEPNPLLQDTLCFESIILFFLRQSRPYLKNLQKLVHDRNNKPNEVHYFLQIHPQNAKIVKQIIQGFDNDDNKQPIVQSLAENIIEYSKDIQGTQGFEAGLIYSQRTQSYDIWNIIIFLLSLESKELDEYHKFVKQTKHDEAVFKKKMNKILRKINKNKLK